MVAIFPQGRIEDVYKEGDQQPVGAENAGPESYEEMIGCAKSFQVSSKLS